MTEEVLRVPESWGDLADDPQKHPHGMLAGALAAAGVTVTNLEPVTVGPDLCHQQNPQSRTRAQYRLFQAKGTLERVSLQEAVSSVQTKDRK